MKITIVIKNIFFQGVRWAVLTTVLLLSGCFSRQSSPPTPQPRPTILFQASSETAALQGIYPAEEIALRSEPSASSVLVGKLTRGTTGMIVDQKSLPLRDHEWVKINYLGQVGWLESSYAVQQEGEIDPELVRMGERILFAIKNQAYQDLVEYLDDQICLRFSPYPYLKDTDKIFCKDDLSGLIKNSEPMLWGQYDGTGKPIHMTFKDYHQEFIYDLDFFHPEVVGYNVEVSTGNAINNIQEVYPGAVFIEYHFSGENPEYAGLDWRSLRLVFVKLAGDWKLAAIVHGEWTI